MQTEPIERDIETLIDLQLKKLGWQDNPKSKERNVWKQQTQTQGEKKALKGLKPDYILYKSGTDIPIVIIEAKRPSRDLYGALIQGKNYADKLNIPIVIATNGIIIKAIHTKTGNALVLDSEEVDSFFDEHIALKFIENDTIDTISKKVINSRVELIKIFKDANAILRKEGLIAGHERFSIFSNILFLKLMSEIQDIKEKNNEPNIIPIEYRWDFFKRKSGYELLSYINDIVLKKFDEYYKSGNDSIFEELKIQNASTLKGIINQLDQLELANIESDIKGDAFEYFLRTYNSGEKDLGEYYTPRHIVKFLVKLLNPAFGETVYDPFCGTGGMLIESFKHLHKTAPINKQSLAFLKKNSVFGREISTTAKIAKMNMILIGDGHNNIKRIDSLANPEYNQYDVVITNMPFSQETEFGNLYDIPTKDANSICVQYCINAINSTSQNGRIGIIVPEKVLFDKSYKALREKIYKTCRIENIISLPSGTFEPYTNVQTSIIHLTKVKQEVRNHLVNFYFVKNDGFSLDKNRKKLLNQANDLDGFFTESNPDNSLQVPIDKIKENNYILQGKKYIPPKELAEITFNTTNLIRLDEVLSKQRNEAVVIEPANNYNLLKVKSYGAGLANKPKKGYELSKGMKHYYAKIDHLCWCKVDTKNGAFGVITQKFQESIITSNFSMLKIDSTKIEPYFLEILLRNKKVQEYFDNYISGSTNRKYVKTDELLQFYIPNYSLEAQRELVAKVLKNEKKIEDAQAMIQSNIDDIL